MILEGREPVRAQGVKQTYLWYVCSRAVRVIYDCEHGGFVTKPHESLIAHHKDRVEHLNRLFALFYCKLCESSEFCLFGPFLLAQLKALSQRQKIVTEKFNYKSKVEWMLVHSSFFYATILLLLVDLMNDRSYISSLSELLLCRVVVAEKAK